MKTLRIVAYNVEFGRRGSAEQIARALLPHRPDVLLLNEAPAGDWCPQLGRALGLPFCFVGSVSSANHVDKYKAIVTRAPLRNPGDVVLQGQGWNPAGAVRAETVLGGRPVALYALHISGAPRPNGDPRGTHAEDLFRVLAAERERLWFAAGDFNDTLDTPTMQSGLARGFRATWQDLAVDLANEYTWDTISEGRDGVIDHILYSPAAGVTASDGGILKFQPPLSDHHPIWAEFRIT